MRYYIPGCSSLSNVSLLFFNFESEAGHATIGLPIGRLQPVLAIGLVIKESVPIARHIILWKHAGATGFLVGGIERCLRVAN